VTLLEVDSRTLSGAGTVELVMDSDRPGFFLVFVKDAAGQNVSTLGATSAGEALEAFRHPFASAVVPDVFRGGAGQTAGK
jgi:hypothetical protein